MFKSFFILILALLTFQKAEAQVEKDTVVYYLKEPVWIVDNKDEAEYIMYNMPADPNTGLHKVVEIYRDGRPKRIAYSKTRKAKFDVQGECTYFFPNGKKRNVTVYKDNNIAGDILNYYPNGQLYTSQKFNKDYHLMLMECRDSTGKVLVENGNGNWIQLDNNFKEIVLQGHVIKGLEDGPWSGASGDSIKYIYLYKKGEIKSGTSYDKSGKPYPFTEVRVNAHFKTGADGFTDFLTRRIHYPDFEKQANIQGQILVSFYVEKDGTLTDFMIAKGRSKGLDDEALRIVKQSPPWIPASFYGIPMRTKITVPVNFYLTPVPLGLTKN